MSLAPNTDNYTLGKGVVYFDQLISGVYQGERDLGNAPAFNVNLALEKLEHYSSRGGTKAKDKEIVSQLTPGCTFTLDEINRENLALSTLGEVEAVTQAVGSESAASFTANLGKRLVLNYRQIKFWLLPYDDAAADNVLFVVGETVTGAGGATGIVVAVTGTATTGTLTIVRTNTTAFVDDEVITGGASGLADVNSATGGTLGTGTPVILVQDSTDTTTYTAGTDYFIDTTLDDDKIGRVLIKEDGSITEGETLHITYGYAAITYNKIKAFSLGLIEGRLRFVSDNPAGNNYEMEVWRASLTPSGDTALIGDDWSTLQMAVEILKDETNHASNPYFQLVMDHTVV